MIDIDDDWPFDLQLIYLTYFYNHSKPFLTKLFLRLASMTDTIVPIDWYSDDLKKGRYRIFGDIQSWWFIRWWYRYIRGGNSILFEGVLSVLMILCYIFGIDRCWLILTDWPIRRYWPSAFWRIGKGHYLIHSDIRRIIQLLFHIYTEGGRKKFVLLSHCCSIFEPGNDVSDILLLHSFDDVCCYSGNWPTDWRALIFLFDFVFDSIRLTYNHCSWWWFDPFHCIHSIFIHSIIYSSICRWSRRSIICLFHLHYLFDILNWPDDSNIIRYWQRGKLCWPTYSSLQWYSILFSYSIIIPSILVF